MQIKERLQPYAASDPTASFASLVSKAYFDRVSLSAFGFYKVIITVTKKTKNIAL